MATVTKKRAATNGKTPIRPLRRVVVDSGDPGYINQCLQATPTRGLVRIEWHAAVKALMVPPNWSLVSMTQRINDLFPLRFSVADAQNLACREVIERDFEWLVLLEDDTCPPPDLYVKFRKYLENGPPVVSALYFTKSEPSEPLIYRGRGTGPYLDWKLGQKVWCDGIPTGCCLIHSSLIRAMWADSEEYLISVSGQRTRRIFRTPTDHWIGANGDINSITGTSDLDWCTRVIEGDYLKKSGWGQYARRKYPFLVDTSIFCSHVAQDGRMFPPQR